MPQSNISWFLAHFGPNFSKFFDTLLNTLHLSLALVINKMHCVITYSNLKQQYTGHLVVQRIISEFLAHLGPKFNNCFSTLLNTLRASLTLVFNKIL